MSNDIQNSNLPDGWIWTTIDEPGIVVSRGTPSTKNKKIWGSEISWITPADLSNYNGKYIAKGSRDITRIGLEDSSAKLLPQGAILFSSRARWFYFLRGYLYFIGWLQCSSGAYD